MIRNTQDDKGNTKMGKTPRSEKMKLSPGSVKDSYRGRRREEEE